MAPHLQRSFGALLFITLIISAFSQDPTPRDFPSILQIESDSYQTDVQITNLDEQLTAFATEYYDESLGPQRGRVDLLTLGDRITVLYYNETNEIVQIQSPSCKVSDISDSLLDYEPMFYGWLNKEPLIIGPTAPIWFAEANRDKIKILDKKTIRGIKCDTYSLDYLTERDNVTYYYYFAENWWDTPYKYENFRTPVRIEVRGIVSEDGKNWVELNQYTDFAYFSHSVANYRMLNPPLGLGCPLKKTTKEMPKFPKVYRYTAEVVNLLQTENEEITDIEYQDVFYDYYNQLSRLDQYKRTAFTSELYDFNTGVTYRIENSYKCTITPLRNSIFEGFDNQIIGHMKDPEEVIGLDEKFYYMGKRLIRGIWADVYESVAEDKTFMGKTVKKLVLSFYYSTEYYEVVNEGNTATRVPVFYVVKGYDETDKVIFNYQYNIFDFDDAIGDTMYSTFDLNSCFPSLSDKSYFLLVMGVTDEKAIIMEGEDDYVIEQLREKITNVSKISDLRIPMLRADYTLMGVIVTGLMLDRPPALSQFWLEDKEAGHIRDKGYAIFPDATTREECAFACVDADSCTGFYFCGETCFKKTKDLLDPDEDDDPNVYLQTTCEEWLRAEKYSNNKEAYLADAVIALEQAVLDGKISVSVKLNPDDPKNNDEVIVPVTDVVFGEGPYTGVGKEEKPYTRVMQFAKLKEMDETTEHISYIDNLNDCYQACKDAKDMTCSSFSYCPDSSNKRCLISSVLAMDRKTNDDNVEDDRDCYVYAMNYMSYFVAYPGKVAHITGVDTLTGVRGPEDCAVICRWAKDYDCRGFEFCKKTSSCVFHSKHVLELKPEKNQPQKRLQCTHYAKKFAGDYLDLGYPLVDDKSDVRTELSLEECAMTCSEELKDKCQSFNFCPASGPQMGDSSCALSPMTLSTPGVTTTTKRPCKHYEKKVKTDDWVKANNAKKSTSGYTAKGFTGLVIGMLILGFALGAVGFVAYSYFRSKSSGEGMTVRFMKQDNI